MGKYDWQVQKNLGLDNIEWRCPECGSFGVYADIRRFFDGGVDLCPDCRSEVLTVDDYERD